MTLWLNFRKDKNIIKKKIKDKNNEVIYHVNKQIYPCGEREELWLVFLAKML